MFKVSGNAVGKSLLEIGPDKFIRIKLRRISWEVKGFDSRTASKESLDKSGSVKGASVPEKDDRTFEMPTELLEKLSDLFGSNILVSVEACVESKAFSFGRDGDRRDRRYFRPAPGNSEPWSFSFDSPGSSDVGNERESTLIQEDQVGSKPIGLFLYEARRASSNNEWLVRDALWLVSGVSDNSSPSNPSDSKDWKYNSSPENSSGRYGRCVSRSKDRSRIRRPRGLSPKYLPEFSSVFPTKVVADLYSAGPSSRSVLSCSTFDANVPPSLTTRSFFERPTGKSRLVSKAGRLGAVFFPEFWDCLEVS